MRKTPSPSASDAASIAVVPDDSPERGTSPTPGFQLVVDPLRAERRDGEHAPVALHVPETGGYLSAETRPALTERRPAGGRNALRIEPIELGATRALVLIAPTDPVRVRVNGLAVPPIAILSVRDQLQVGAGPVLFVTTYRRPDIVQPTGALLDQSCGVCRIDLTEDTTVLVHDCGVALHLEPATRPPSMALGERLRCALLGDCPSCKKPVRTEPGFEWLPEVPR